MPVSMFGQCPLNVFFCFHLHNGFFFEFNHLYIEMTQQRPVDENWRKWHACCDAYDSIPASHIVAYFRECGLVGKESLDATRHHFLARSGALTDDEN